MTHPIDVAVLADYWLAALSPSDEEVVEQHLLECDACGSRLREIIALADGIRRLARTGSLRMIVSDAFVSRAADEGLQVREYSSAPGGSVYCTVTADDDLLIARLTGDVSGVARLDLAFCDAQGVEQRRLPDIPVRAGAPSVLYQESMAFAGTSYSATGTSTSSAVSNYSFTSSALTTLSSSGTDIFNNYLAGSYASREAYLAQFTQATDALIQQRWILPEDRAALLQRAAQEWDYLTR